MSLPTREAVLAFLAASPADGGRRAIARAFGVKGADRAALRELLSSLEEEGLLARGPGGSLHGAHRPPRVTTARVVRAEGARLWVEPERWDRLGAPPRMRLGVMPGRPPRVGDRLLVRVDERADGLHARAMKRLPERAERMLGIAREEAGRLMLQPVDKRLRRAVPLVADGELALGTLVSAELSGGRTAPRARVAQTLGEPFRGGNLSLIALAERQIPVEFSAEVENEAARAADTSQPTAHHADRTAIPFVTIDPADARDRDDAVFAEPWGKGWRLLVAIADVAHHVRPGGALDRAAQERGNSVYFPDRVVPMLPHALSSEACSLHTGEDRLAMVAEMRFDARGRMTAQSVERAQIRLRANLAYEEVEAARGAETPLGRLVQPLYRCWAMLHASRQARSPLDLDLPERRVVLDGEGRVAHIHLVERLDAHRLIEDMMIAANVAVARLLEARQRACLYRVHEAPSDSKLDELADYLGTLDLPLARGQAMRPALFNRVLERARGRPDAEAIAQQVLRAQAQARYAPDRLGHFGLALDTYAHFTSPIRRYADLVVHRQLIEALGLGPDGLAPSPARLAALGEHLSMTERRAMEAERATLDRYLALHLAGRVGEVLKVRVTGVTGVGLFATVLEMGGDGFLPVSALGEEGFHFDDRARALVGLQSGQVYRVGDRLDLRLVRAEPASGALLFAPAEPPPGLTPRAAAHRRRAHSAPGGRRVSRR